MHRRCWGSLGVLLATLCVTTAPAGAAVPHVVQPGETLWSIAAANNLTTRTVAAFNGLPEDASVIAGETIQVPTIEEGAVALETAGLTAAPAEPAAATVAPAPTEPAPAATSSAHATTTEAGAPLGHIPGPYGELHLEASAAVAWNAMREESLRLYGIDLYPAGPLSAYRTSEEQQYLYELYVAGAGAPADPPGLSSHQAGTAVDLATEEMRWVVDQIGAAYGWAKIEAPSEWWHVNYVGG
jgi:LysM repeat protein